MKTNYQTGHDAEKAAAAYLEEKGYEIVELNWKTKFCEIDIVAKKNKKMFFIEVKSRRSAKFGSGFDYITPKKIKQMTFAAQMWVANNKWPGDYQLGAVDMTAGEVKFALVD